MSRPAAPTAPPSLLALRALALALGLLMGGCLSPRQAKEARELRRSADAEAQAAEDALAAAGVDAALLDIARRQDARRDHVELVQWTRHPSARVRAAAARAVALVGDARAGDVLAYLLEDPSEDVVLAAAYGLGQFDFWRATALEQAQLRATLEDALRTELDDCRNELRFGAGRTEVCRVVARSLGAVGEESGEEALWAALQKGVKPDPLRRALALALAVQAKDGRGSPITEERLTWLAPLLLNSDDSAQWAAAYLLARADVAEPARPTLASLLALAWDRSTQTTARTWLLRAMGRSGDEASLATLGAVLQDPAAGPREVTAAARAAPDALRPALLARLDLGPPLDLLAEVVGALARLEAATSEPGEEVRQHLRATITGDPEPALLIALAPLAATGWSKELLLPHLAGPGPVRGAAAAALSATEGDDVDAALVGALESADGLAARIDVAAALAERPSPAIEGALLALALDPDPILGAIAAEGLGPRPGGHVTARLLEAWDAAAAPEQWERRLALAKALLTRDDVAPDRIKQAMEDPEPLVRAAAEAAVIEKFDRSQSAESARPRPLPEFTDPLRGVGDVTGATVTTDRGVLELALYPRLAPGTVANFVDLAERDWFDGLTWHRVVEDFVVQTGDPIGNGWGGPGTTLRCETSEEPYRRGTVGMALSGRDTGGSQWFITLSPQPHLDGRYTVFGQVEAGWDVLDGIAQGDRIQDVTITRRTQP